MFSQKFPVHSFLEDVFLKQYTQCFYKKHSVRCITDYMTLPLEEKIRSLTNKAAHRFLLQNLRRTLIIPNLVSYPFDPRYFLLYHFNIFYTLFMQVNWIMKKILADWQSVNGWHCCAKLKIASTHAVLHLIASYLSSSMKTEYKSLHFHVAKRDRKSVV